MFILFGARSTKVDQEYLDGVSCPHCNTNGNLLVSRYSRYFHIFWIPFFPVSKSTVAECTHCRKSFHSREFTPSMETKAWNRGLNRPAKTPIWQFVGLFCFAGIIAMCFLLAALNVSTRKPTRAATSFAHADSRKALLDDDYERMTAHVSLHSDSIAFYLKNCLDAKLVDDLDKNAIRYATRQQGDKLLVLVEMQDISKVEPSSRKQLIRMIERCLDHITGGRSLDYYIGVEGKWNTVLLETPEASDVDGKFADKYLLLPFYDSTRAQVDTLYGE